MISSDKTRHIERRHLVIREREAQGTSKVTKVDTTENLADMMTKSVPRQVQNNILAIMLGYEHADFESK